MDILVCLENDFVEGTNTGQKSECPLEGVEQTDSHTMNDDLPGCCTEYLWTNHFEGTHSTPELTESVYGNNSRSIVTKNNRTNFR